MPKVYRSMYEDDGSPRVGAGSTLGVRLPGGPHKPDILPDEAGCVRPGTGGMSVAPSLEALLRDVPTYVPKRLRKLAQQPGISEELRALCSRAAGTNSLRVWSTGTEPFEDAPVGSELFLHVDRPDHGCVEP